LGARLSSESGNRAAELSFEVLAEAARPAAAKFRALLQLGVGRHRIRVTKSGDVDWMKVIWVTGDAELILEPEFKDPRPAK